MLELPIVQPESTPPKRRKPEWLRVKLPIGTEYKKVRTLVDEYQLHTICQ
ncbi:MAG: lipoyl synthase, partial [Saprospiraceae bacterium]|nr:lipoyl synthase [Saprospiraceae bacterium]